MANSKIGPLLVRNSGLWPSFCRQPAYDANRSAASVTLDLFASDLRKRCSDHQHSGYTFLPKHPMSFKADCPHNHTWSSRLPRTLVQDNSENRWFQYIQKQSVICLGICSINISQHKNFTSTQETLKTFNSCLRNSESTALHPSRPQITRKDYAPRRYTPLPFEIVILVQFIVSKSGLHNKERSHQRCNLLWMV